MSVTVLTSEQLPSARRLSFGIVARTLTHGRAAKLVHRRFPKDAKTFVIKYLVLCRRASSATVFFYSDRKSKFFAETTGGV